LRKSEKEKEEMELTMGSMIQSVITNETSIKIPEPQGVSDAPWLATPIV
jgi:hypothetical protein